MTRVRYGRLGVLCAAAGVTVVAVLGGLGLAPFAPEAGFAEPRAGAEPTGAVVLDAPPAAPGGASAPVPTTQTAPLGPASPTADESLPAGSGEGRRVVFSQSRQRVWLVGADGAVRRTYLVSGSLTDNLEPGRYEVWSRSRHAVGIDESGEMEWFVRFAHGKRAAIGFHSIPVDAGRRVQTTAQLGTRTSHGCIRQATPDARAMWAFAGTGTRVVVV